MKILRASEDYLEAMLMMKEKHGYIRSIDVAEQLGVTKPSVTYTTKRLRENGYITMDKDGFITLSESGMQIASSMLERHRMLSSFLIALGVASARRRSRPRFYRVMNSIPVIVAVTLALIGWFVLRNFIITDL